MPDEARSHLKSIWDLGAEPDVRCCVCMRPITEEALVRTFGPVVSGQQQQHGAKVLRTPDDHELMLYDRHMSCLLRDKIHYVTVSHVWHKGISEIQNQGHVDCDPDLERLAFRVPAEIAQSISEALGHDTEVWHDYISVPQWTPHLKIPILETVHQIYAHSTLTVIHLDDVTPTMLDNFLHAPDDADRRAGMIGLCNAAWFGRVWTAMEYIRSANVRVMDSEQRLHGTESEQLYWGQIDRLWNEQIAKNEGKTVEMENRMGIGKNIIPWNLGRLGMFRVDSNRRKFGPAFALLSRRGCRDRNDFLYALQGIITGDSVTRLEGRDWDETYVNLAHQCLREGDYTPLLVTPDGVDVRNMPDKNIREGYIDIHAFSLGHETSPPENHHALRIADNGDVILKMQKAGIVYKSKLWNGRYDHLAHFCAHNLATPSAEAFAEAFGSRLFGESKEHMMQALSHDDRRQKLEETIVALSKAAPGHPWPQDSPYDMSGVFQVLGLSEISHGREQPRLKFQFLHGSTMHLKPHRFHVWVKCAACGAASVVDAGLYVENDGEQVHGTTVYRFPGLGYFHTHRGGICLLVDDRGRIVGRTIWATPACSCEEMKTVRLQMPNLPKPRPRSEICEQLGRTS